MMNMMAGHNFLMNTLGIQPPKHAWQIDNFGHSAATPMLFQKMGFETLSLARMGEQEKFHRKKSKSLEFIWASRRSLEAE